jgi:hypothetical protein
MGQHDIALMRANARFARQDYDKQMLQSGGVATADYGSAGPPYWNRAAWDAFKAQYGHYPYSASELPPNFESCPDWAYELMGLRKPPITVNPGGR